MSFIDRIRSFFPDRPIAIKLNLAAREGGYVFVSSPQLRGFNLLLDPGEDYSDLKTFVDAVSEPLTVYMNEFQRARHAQREKLRLRSAEMDGDGSLVANLCFQ
jgi:hypothetical protein